MRHRKAGSSASAGFTLIEVIMVMVLITFVAVVASPRFQNLTGTRAQAAAFKLRSDLRYIQMLSIETQNPTRAVFDTDTHSYQLEMQTGADWNIIKNPGTRADYTVALNAGDFQGVTLSEVNFNGTAAVVFDRLGIPYDGNGGPIDDPDPGFISLSGQYQVTVARSTGKMDVVTL